jgi:heme-degrading monooxygenase HmoA
MIAKTPEPPYYAVIFTSLRTDVDDGYVDVAARMVELASGQEGYLGVEYAREEVGITVSYWSTPEAIAKWRQHAEHRLAQEKGISQWYRAFKTRVCKVERDNGFEKPGA